MIKDMRPHPETDEGPKAAQRFIKALATVLAVPRVQRRIPSRTQNQNEKGQPPERAS